MPMTSSYRLYASAAALLNFLKGESGFQPSYVANAPRRARRSLTDLGKSFTYGRDAIESGALAGALVLYAATIGEFHPLTPVVDAFLERHPGTPLVVFSGQTQYIDAIHAAYPEAAVGLLPSCAPWLYDRMFRLVRPCAVILGEGPCLPLHFPIAFDMALAAACVRYDVPMAVANATLHKYLVPSRMDYLEARMFGGLFTRALRFWYTPNEVFKSWLLRARVPAERIIVTGDLRFDGLHRLAESGGEQAEILRHMRESGGPVIVAGSVNAIDEEAAVVDGWLDVRRRHPQARLIVAPRHVNNAENMAKLYDYLRSKDVRFARRSEGLEASRQADALVVDVFGELPHYYSIASAAYIGRNHGVLEPLRFEVPTVVAPRADWGADYVTFPAYKHMIDQRAIIEAPDKRDIGGIFLRIVEEPGYGRAYVDNALQVAARERGAGRRIAEHLDSVIRK
jgi:3-deoxy-D-manno-octulosonic-acid transferase